MKTPNVKDNVSIQADDHAKSFYVYGNVIIQPDDNINVILSQDHNIIFNFSVVLSYPRL
jgi:hypothetical protein